MVSVRLAHNFSMRWRREKKKKIPRELNVLLWNQYMVHSFSNRSIFLPFLRTTEEIVMYVALTATSLLCAMECSDVCRDPVLYEMFKELHPVLVASHELLFALSSLMQFFDDRRALNWDPNSCNCKCLWERGWGGSCYADHWFSAGRQN